MGIARHIHAPTAARTFRVAKAAWRGLSAWDMREAVPMTPVGQKPRSRQGSEKRKRRVMLTARVDPDEERQIREAARRHGVSVATLLRNAALSAAAES